ELKRQMEAPDAGAATSKEGAV
ncbi:MAG: hypothetical protein RJB65_827, partial [Actinomycetota bacterium]